MPTTLIFGGSFDPVHNGHLNTAAGAAKELGAHRVLLIPAAVSPHKTSSAPRALAEDRVAMLRLAVAGDALFEVSEIEIRRPPPSYTVDTVEALRAANPGEDFVLLIGADQIPKFTTWHRAADLRKLVRVAILARPGSNLALPEGTFSVAAPLVDLSSTEIRRRILNGEAIDDLVPRAVAEYIRAHGLYK